MSVSQRAAGVESAESAPAAERVNVIASLLWTALLAAGCVLAWQGIGVIQMRGYSIEAWPFPVGCALAAIGLRMLDDALRSSPWSSFVPETWAPPVPWPGRLRTAVLAALGLGAIACCFYILRHAPAEQAAAAGAWVAAQLLILAAAFPPVGRPVDEPRVRLLGVTLVAILLAAVATRFWQIGFYPDYVHHDHALFGHEVLRIARGDWQPFFQRVYSVGRPALLPTLLGLRVFGTEYWVLRLSAAVSGVVLAWGAFLLGRALFSRRAGLIAALLVTVNHVLLLYSRQPYVLDPAAPFVLALYCAATGLERGSRFHWCLAGVLTGWSLLGYYVAVTYVPILAGVLVYLACFHPRSFWRARMGFLWFLAGAGIVYFPMLVQSGDSAIVQRTNSTVIFFDPDGSIRWNAELWANQLGRSFGYIFHYYTDYPWGVSAGQPICMRIESCLFGIGLAYLLLRLRSVATFALLLWIVTCIFLGSATQPSPPTPYHFLAAVVAIMLVGAVPLDRALAAVDRWRPPYWRALPLLGAMALLGATGAANVDAVWKGVGRRPPEADGRPVFRADAGVMAARLVRQRPGERYYLVRSGDEPSAVHATFRFFADDSTVSDLNEALDEALPVPPVEPPAGVSFIVFPGRSAERAVLERVYPGARAEPVHFGHRETRSIWVYRIDKGMVRAVFDTRRAGSAETTGAPSQE